MEINQQKIKILELVDGYADDGQGGVRGYGGKLDIRPPYQREFIYKPKERDEVIKTVMKGFPLNVMYWAVRGNGTFEVIDGQQRTISIAQFNEGDFSVEFDSGIVMYEDNAHFDKDKFLNYEIDVYLCDGAAREKLAWFKTINIAGKELSAQEMRNAVYHGAWTADARKWFNDVGRNIAKDYMPPSKLVRRQDYFETAIKWIKDDSESIDEYMAAHKNDADASDLTSHFRAVIDRVQEVFPTYHGDMKFVDWGGKYYEALMNPNLDPVEMDREAARLRADEDVRNGKGIYPYLLSGKVEEHHLNLRSFDKTIKRVLFEKMNGVCRGVKGVCQGGKKVVLEDLEADHIVPWSRGGKTDIDNCQLICRDCNRRKSNK